MAFIVVLMDQELHDLSDFDCGNEKLNNWLKNTAPRHQKGTGGRNSKTYVLVDENNQRQVIGFFAIAIRGVVPTENLPLGMAKKLPDQVPALTLARLATDARFQGQGHGEFMLYEAMAITKAISNAIGGYALFVDAKPGKASFYEKYRFIPYPKDPDTLFLPFESIDI